MLKTFKGDGWRKFRDSGSLLTVLTVLGVAVGVALGIGLKAVKQEWTPREVMYFKFIGELFLRTLSALILPLIVASLVDAIGSLDLGLSRKIGTRALVYYLGTTAVAAVLGIILGVVVRPGSHSGFVPGESCQTVEASTVEDTLLDLIRNVFPNNLVGAALEVAKTKVNNTDLTIPYGERSLEIGTVPGTNMLGLVVFAMVLGVTLGNMKSAGKPVLDFFKCLGDATMVIITKVVSFSPVAICSLVASQLLQEDIQTVFQNIAWYFGTVMIGLFLHGVILLPLLYFFLTRLSPFKFFYNMSQSIATAFGTASSSATLPVTLKCLEENNNIDVRVSRFVIPIGATVNMNGTALYLPVGAIYIAQLCGRDLSIGELIAVSLISIATSIGAAGIPQVGMVIMLTVLSSVGLPPDYIAFIMPIDWLLERFRTAVNVLGDSFGAGIVAHMSKDDLANIPFANATDSSQSSQSTDDDAKDYLDKKMLP